MKKKKNTPFAALAISLPTWMEDLMACPLASGQDRAALFLGQLQLQHCLVISHVNHTLLGKWL
jgi:hypothetical protein